MISKKVEAKPTQFVPVVLIDIGAIPFIEVVAAIVENNIKGEPLRLPAYFYFARLGSVFTFANSKETQISLFFFGSSPAL